MGMETHHPIPAIPGSPLIAWWRVGQSLEWTAMTVKEFARSMGYKADALVALAKEKGIKLPAVEEAVDAKLASAVRAQVPHRAKLAGTLLEVFTKITPAAKAKEPARTPRPVARSAEPKPAVKAAEPRPAKSGGLAEALKGKPAKIAVDTSSLMMDRAVGVYRAQVRPALKAGGCTLLVPAKVVEELRRHASRTDEALAESSIQGLGVLSFLAGEGLTEEVKSAADVHADEDMLALVNRFRSRYSVNVLTQDVALMVDIYSMGKAESVREIKPPAVWEIKNGQLRHVTEVEALQRRKRQKGLRS